MPNLRFKGFTDDWEQRKLIDGCEYVDYRGKTPNKTENGVFLVTAKNVKAGYIDYEASQEYIAEEDYDEVMHRGMPQIGDVLITTEAPCGNVAQVDREDIALAQRIIKYRGHENQIDNTYLKHYLLTPYFQGVLESKSSGGTVQGIKGSILHQQIIRHPSFEEQVKIGRHLDSIDNLIALHQRKCDELQKVKKYMLQKMFPKKGEKVPEIRLAGFTGDWVQRKLGEILQFQNGFNGGREAYGEGTAFISVMDILNNQFITYDCIRGKATVNADELERFSVRYGDVLFQRSSENVEDAGTSNVYVDADKTAIFGGFVIRGRQIAPYSPRFMKYLLDTKAVRKQITKKAQGAQHVNVSQETLQDVQVSLPSQEEQEAVESCLCNLDNLIALHQRKHETLKEIKKYMLQNMFPKK